MADLVELSRSLELSRFGKYSGLVVLDLLKQVAGEDGLMTKFRVQLNKVKGSVEGSLLDIFIALVIVCE